MESQRIGRNGPNFKHHEKANKMNNMINPGITIKLWINQLRIDLDPEIKICEITPKPPSRQAKI